MIEPIEIECPSCQSQLRRAATWLKRHSELRCPGCGADIHVGASKRWGELRRVWKAVNHDGPLRRRLP